MKNVKAGFISVHLGMVEEVVWWGWGRGRGGGGGCASMLPRLATRVSQVLSHGSETGLVSPVSPMVPNVAKYNVKLFAWVGVGRRRREERSLQLRNSTIRNQFS